MLYHARDLSSSAELSGSLVGLGRCFVRSLELTGTHKIALPSDIFEIFACLGVYHCYLTRILHGRCAKSSSCHKKLHFVFGASQFLRTSFQQLSAYSRAISVHVSRRYCNDCSSFLL